MGFFNSYTKPGKGINKEDLDKSGIALYFDIFLRRFWKLITINFMYLIASIPAIIIGSFIAYYLMNVVINVMEIKVDENTLVLVRYLMIPFVVFILQVTGSGPASVAKDYMIRKYVKDTHVWLWHDFVSTFKKNFKQGIAIYIINTLLFFALAFSFLFYRFMLPGTMGAVLSKVMLALGVIFFIAQKYVYVLVSGFELKIRHIYKNAFLLVFVGAKWNILSLFFVFAMMVGCASLYSSNQAIGVLLVLCLYFSIISFTQIFLTRNVIGKYLEEPAIEMEKENNSDDEWD